VKKRGTHVAKANMNLEGLIEGKRTLYYPKSKKGHDKGLLSSRSKRKMRGGKEKGQKMRDAMIRGLSRRRRGGDGEMEEEYCYRRPPER
jgi:hypothetical protein